MQARLLGHHAPAMGRICYLLKAKNAIIESFTISSQMIASPIWASTLYNALAIACSASQVCVGSSDKRMQAQQARDTAWCVFMRIENTLDKSEQSGCSMQSEGAALA
jgi:hypothetical protein